MYCCSVYASLPWLACWSAEKASSHSRNIRSLSWFTSLQHSNEVEACSSPPLRNQSRNQLATSSWLQPTGSSDRSGGLFSAYRVAFFFSARMIHHGWYICIVHNNSRDWSCDIISDIVTQIMSQRHWHKLCVYVNHLRFPSSSAISYCPVLSGPAPHFKCLWCFALL